MKKTIFCVLFSLVMAGFASAQTSASKNAHNKTVSKHSSKSKKSSVRKTSAAKTVGPDNRKEYMKDGQKATPTGHDAAPTNGEQYQSIRDTVNKKGKKQ